MEISKGVTKPTTNIAVAVGRTVDKCNLSLTNTHKHKEVVLKRPEPGPPGDDPINIASNKMTLSPIPKLRNQAMKTDTRGLPD